jgi:hypothetical protein
MLDTEVNALVKRLWKTPTPTPDLSSDEGTASQASEDSETESLPTSIGHSSSTVSSVKSASAPPKRYTEQQKARALITLQQNNVITERMSVQDQNVLVREQCNKDFAHSQKQREEQTRHPLIGPTAEQEFSPDQVNQARVSIRNRLVAQRENVESLEEFYCDPILVYRECVLMFSLNRKDTSEMKETKTTKEIEKKKENWS